MKLFRWFGLITEDWGVNVDRVWWKKKPSFDLSPIKPYSKIKAGEEYDVCVRYTAFYMFNKPLVVFDNNNPIKPFFNPKESPFRKRV